VKPLPQAWQQQLPRGHSQRFASGERIVAPGRQSNRVFIVDQGRARICLYGAAREQTLGYLHPGSVYVTHTPAWVEAQEPTIIRSWAIGQIKALFEPRPDLAIGALREVGILLFNSINLIEDLAFRSVEGQLARFLLSEAESQPAGIIKLPGTTESLASLLGTSRQTLSSLLTRMERQQLIARPDRSTLQLLDTDRIRQLTDSVSAS